MNEPAESINQIRRTLAASPSGTKVAGVALYSYGATRAGTPDDGATPANLSAQVWAALADNGPANGNQAPFATRTSPPAVAAKAGPTTGITFPASTSEGDARTVDLSIAPSTAFQFGRP